jgi:hypothetical protein
MPFSISPSTGYGRSDYPAMFIGAFPGGELWTTFPGSDFAPPIGALYHKALFITLAMGTGAKHDSTDAHSRDVLESNEARY